MKILFTANPLVGHVFPLLPLMGAARAAGHDVVIATGADLIPELRSRGFSTWTVGPSFGDAVAELQRSATGPAAAGPAAPGAELAGDAVFLFARPSVRRAVDLIPRAAAWGPDLVIGEITEFAGREAALATGALPITHGFGTHVPESARFARIIIEHMSSGLGTPNPRVSSTPASTWTRARRACSPMGCPGWTPDSSDPAPARSRPESGCRRSSSRCPSDRSST